MCGTLTAQLCAPARAQSKLPARPAMTRVDRRLYLMAYPPLVLLFVGSLACGVKPRSLHRRYAQWSSEFLAVPAWPANQRSRTAICGSFEELTRPCWLECRAWMRRRKKAVTCDDPLTVN